VRRTAVIAGALIATGFGAVAWAAQIRSLDVDRKKGRYSLLAETWLDASPADIFEVLLDYDRFNRISSVYKEHGYLEPAEDGTPIIYTKMEGCMLFYCLSMRRVERLETERPNHIKTITLPDQSNFRYSTSEWWLEPEASGTRMTYQLEMEPDFWVPPVIGPWYLKKTLKRGGGDAVDRIESLAQAVEEAQGA
jgi:hypothetical protein